MTYWIIVAMMLVAIVAVVLALGMERDGGHPEVPEPIELKSEEQINDADV